MPRKNEIDRSVLLTRVPTDLHKVVSATARRLDLSVNEYVAQSLARVVGLDAEAVLIANASHLAEVERISLIGNR